MRPSTRLRLALAAGLLSASGLATGQQPLPEATPLPRPLIAASADPVGVLEGPILVDGPSPAQLQPAPTEEGDRTLPINLATALRLADARPLVIEAALAGVQIAAAQLEQARVLWLPTLYSGIDYYRHDGGAQNENGVLFTNGRTAFLAGGGATAIFATTDAIFTPLAVRQVLRAQQADVQTARNDALFAVAEAYFNVQQARGDLAGTQDTVKKATELTRRVELLSKDLVPPVEVDRVRTLLADLEQNVAQARADWRVASAGLTRVLRLDPSVVVTPLEPPHLQVTLISPRQPVDGLIPIGLTSRPELAAQQALVQATLERLRQERLRPLIPSLVMQGNAVPGGRMIGGVYGSGSNGSANPWVGRSDVDVELLWELKNLGLGNRGLVRERQGQQRQALVELFRVQDLVAAEVVQAHAQLEAALVRIGKSQVGVQEGLINYAGNIKGLSETLRFGDVLQLITRPQEAVAALQQLAQAYHNYFKSIADFNRSQFRLYRALGYPARILICERTPGEVLPVDVNRPALMAPVCAPEPCLCPER